MRRLPGALVVDAAVLMNPLLDPDSTVDSLGFLAFEMLKWLPGVARPRVHTAHDDVSQYARWVLSRCAYVGADVEPLASRDAQERTRYAWHIVSEVNPESPLPLRADRVRRFVVPMDEEPPWDTVHRAVVEYAALMAFPSRE